MDLEGEQDQVTHEEYHIDFYSILPKHKISLKVELVISWSESILIESEVMALNYLSVERELVLQWVLIFRVWISIDEPNVVVYDS